MSSNPPPIKTSTFESMELDSSHLALQGNIAVLYPMAKLDEAKITPEQLALMANAMNMQEWERLTYPRFDHLAEKFLSSQQVKLIKVQKRNPSRKSRPPVK